MANNMVVGYNVAIPTNAVVLNSTGAITEVNTDIIFQFNPTKSFKKGRTINALTQLTVNKGVLVKMKTVADFTAFLLTSLPESFDTTLSFAGSVNNSAAGVAATASTADTDTLFEFSAVSPLIGTPLNMNLKIAGVLKMIVTTQTDYSGRSFKFTDSNGVIHMGVFTAGDVNF